MKDWWKYFKIRGTLLMIIMVSACSQADETKQQQLVGEALGTTYQISLYPQQEKDFQASVDSVFTVINQSMSTYLPDSDISRINRGDTTVHVDQMFREVFELSNSIYRKTNGYFDPTVGVLTNAWGFGPGKAIDMDSLKVDSLLQFVGFDKVKLDAEGRIKKTHNGVAFDFNAIAKGYAVDRLGVTLENMGIENYLVEVGGEVRARGLNLDNKTPWKIGVDDPAATTQRELVAVISLENLSLASSGNYRKFRIDPDTGQKYVHTIDPKSGYTRNSNVLAATVIAATCAEADGYATAFMAMPLEKSVSLLEANPQLEAMIIYTDETGTVQEFVTDGFAQLRLK